MNSFYKGRRELPNGKDFSRSPEIKSKKIRVQLPELLASFQLYFTRIFQVRVKHYLSTDIALFTQSLRKKIDNGKMYYKGTCPVLQKRLQSSDQKITKQEISSSSLRALFGWPSGLLRICVGPSSGVLRLLFGCSSGRSRSAVEADSKPSRSVAEHVSNKLRRDPEALPKSTRRGAERPPSSDNFRINFALSSTFYAGGSQFSSNFHRCGSAENLSQFEENLRKGRSWSGVGRELNGLFLATKGTVSSPLSYRECTEKAPKRYWGCTKELPEIYQRGTKKVRAVGSSLVALGYKSDSATAQSEKGEDAGLDNGREGIRFKFDAFKTFYECVVSAIDSFVVDDISKAQRALKCFAYLSDYKNTFRMSLTCLALVFRSSNFSFKALKSIRALMVLALMVSMFSLSAQTPRKDSGADGLSQVGAMSIGDRVDDEFYSRMHKSVDWKSKVVKEINLKAHKDKLIILDFWASWCSPCLSSLKKLDSLKKTWDADKVIVIPVAYEPLKDIARILAYFKWDYNTIFQDTYLKTRFPHQGLPFMVWIKDGRVIATPKAGYATTENVNAVLTGKNLEVFNKTDVKLIDTSRVFFTKGNGQPDRSFYDTKDAKLVGYIQGYSETNFNVFKTKDSLTLYVINSTIDRIYREAYKDIVYPYQSKKQSLQWEIGADFLPYLEKSKPRENWTGDLSKDKQLQQWKSMHCFSMMVTVPRDSGITGARSKVRKLLASSIEQKFGLSPKVKFAITQRYPVLALTETKQSAEIKLSQLLRTPPKKGYENYAVPFGDQPHFKLFIETALKNISSLRLTEYRIWDRTGIAPDFPVKFSFPVNLAQERKFANVQNLLKQYGLQVLVEEKPIPYLCIGQLADNSKSNGHENL
ncbi:TlpA family protein disulfide reductase [Sphingobacterium athyrii]|uniref:TlpA family protein disulfide reductase n=1 Tax=Sphingobacterium athyrii TaxID=2152717 RepID=UPI0028B1FFBD|nr:TlpA disulfide reductase family protein [Sphingobacterium athyrii]